VPAPWGEELGRQGDGVPGHGGGGDPDGAVRGVDFSGAESVRGRRVHGERRGDDRGDQVGVREDEAGH